MNYKKIIAILLVFAFVGGVAAEDSLPLLPDEFRGSVTINGNPAPVGTVLTAYINDELRGTVTTTEAGTYGGLELDDRRLIVTGYDGEVDAAITFKVNGYAAPETSTFTPGETQRLDLSATYTPPSPGGGGSGGGGSSGSFYSPTVTVTSTPVAETATTTPVPPTSVPDIPVSDGSDGQAASGDGGDGTSGSGDDGTAGDGNGPDGTTLVVGAVLVGAVIAGAGVYHIKKK